MRRHAAIALALASALPACAQRGGGHAGFAARSAPAMRSAPSFHYSGTAHAPMIYAPRTAAPGLRYPAATPAARPIFYHRGGAVVRTYPYPYGYYPGALYVSGFYDDGDDYNPNLQPDYGSNSLQPDYGYPAQPEYGYPEAAPDAYSQPMPGPESGYANPQPPPAYPGYPQPAPQGAYTYPQPAPGYQTYPPAQAAPQMQYVPGSADAVTLIYKDGRPPEQIQNYLATRSTLTILDGSRRRIIPLSDLDIPATVRANRQTGVDFSLPTATP